MIVAEDFAGYIPSDKTLIPKDWPWDLSWLKPSPDPKHNLVKAGALIAAEIDRLNRLPKGPEAASEPKQTL
jgi:hypothetical protein